MAACEGLYLLAMSERNGEPEMLLGMGDGDAKLGITHEDAASFVEQFAALKSIEARNAYGDALLLLARLVSRGAKIGLPELPIDGDAS